jgi:hypothetical protein
MVGSKASFTEIKTEANNMRDRAMNTSDSHLLLAQFLMKVEEGKLGYLGMHGGEFTFTLASDTRFLISVRVLIKLNNLANKNTRGISRVGSCINY